MALPNINFFHSPIKRVDSLSPEYCHLAIYNKKRPLKAYITKRALTLLIYHLALFLAETYSLFVVLFAVCYLFQGEYVHLRSRPFKVMNIKISL